MDAALVSKHPEISLSVENERADAGRDGRTRLASLYSQRERSHTRLIQNSLNVLIMRTDMLSQKKKRFWFVDFGRGKKKKKKKS